MNNFGRYWKSIVAFIAPAAVVIGEAVVRASVVNVGVDWSATLILALVAAVTTSGGVYLKANDPPHNGSGSDPEHNRPAA